MGQRDQKYDAIPSIHIKMVPNVSFSPLTSLRSIPFNMRSLTVFILAVAQTTFGFLSDVHLYSEADHNGFIQTVKMVKIGKTLDFLRCTNVHNKSNEVKSLDTGGACVELYEQDNCTGNQRTIFSRTFSYHNFRQGQRVASMGTCNTIVDLYDGYNYTGVKERVKLWGNFDCVRLNPGDMKTVRSTDTHGGCVILHNQENCKGPGLTYSAGPRNPRKFLTWSLHNQIKSLHSCQDADKFKSKTDDLKLTPRVQPREVRYTPARYIYPVFAQYLPFHDSVVIKVGETPPRDHFCELAKRCTQNRAFDCDRLSNYERCYCHATNKIVTCDPWRGLSNSSGDHFKESPPRPVDVGQGSSFIQDNFQINVTRFSLVGEIVRGSSGCQFVTILSEKYETPYANVCTLVDRCGFDYVHGPFPLRDSYCSQSVPEVGGRGGVPTICSHQNKNGTGSCSVGKVDGILPAANPRLRSNSVG